MIINRELYKIKEIPSFIPMTEEYINFWREEKYKCLNGAWVGGLWIPGNLYFYINYWNIEIKESKFSKNAKVGNPFLRDIDFDFTIAYNEARGFSRFEKQSLEDIEGMTPREIMTKQYQTDMGKPLFENQAKNMILLGNRGCGKDLFEDEIVYLENSEKKIKDILIGDRIFDHNGTLTTIIDIKKYYDQVQYEIEFADKRKIICGGGHLWTVIDSNRRKKTLTTLQILENINYGKRKDSNYFIQINDEVQYETKDFILDPYTLGVLLGYGGMTNNSVTITVADEEIVSHIPYEVHKLKGKYRYSIVGINDKVNKLNLRKKSENKEIPNEYFYGSIEQRYNLLRGLMDTDGSIYKKGQIEFSTSSEKLRDGVLRLLRSLGIRCQYSIRKTTHLDSYRINILTGKPIFKLKRKLDRININPSNYAIANRSKVAIRNIKEIGVKPSVCIAVDNEDKLFLTSDFVVTHNSFLVAGTAIGYEFLFEKEKGEKNQIVVGAGETKYSADLLKKVKTGLDFLPGAQEFSGRYYPAPFSKKYRGSFESGKAIEAKYEAYIGGTKVWKGTGSNIKHISYKNNALASNGTRPCLSIFEEAGIFDNLLDAWDSSVETVRYGINQFGTMIALGTGGDMTSGSVNLSNMFYDTETYNLVAFEDTWENKGKIGMFIPATRGLNDYKDENGNSKEEEAKEYLLAYRANLISSNAAKSTFEQEIQYRPLVPSEAFLISGSNIFPQKMLLEQLNYLENSERGKNIGQVGELFYIDGKMSWNPSNKLREIKNYPLKKNDDARGAITIFEHPYLDENGNVPPYLYIAGCDPYDHDKSGTGSLGSLFVYKRFQDFDNTSDIIVAEYTGRPDTADEYYENARNLLIYYNAVCLYENERKGMHQHFRIKNCEYLLADQPEYIHDIIRDTHVDRGKGVHMTQSIKDHMEIKMRDWLITEYKEGHYNLEKIYSVALLKELIKYNDKGNFDRFIAFAMVLMQNLDMHKIKVKKASELSSNAKYFPEKLFTNKPQFV